ncbi:MAG: M15 family metallopeptidase [SAR324 cluster bacterium]|nr:M15 family metallopeptidase [SAR324 cluster bacterium]
MSPQKICLFSLPGFLLLLCLMAAAGPARAAELTESMRFLSASPEFVDVTGWPALVIDLKYATKDNFVGENLYGPFRKAYLHREAAAKLKRAIHNLKVLAPGFRFVIFDALRPRSVQWLLWNKVVGTPEQKYVANPSRGSVHNYGFALDLSLLDAAGREVDMGTPFDNFTRLAQPRYERHFLKTGRLTKAQYRNRRLLKRVMHAAGFRRISNEWWHFNALSIRVLRKNYRIVE